jgi:hypothetical protein
LSEQLQLRRGTATQVAAFTGVAGELVVDTTNNRLVLQDGATAGGFAAAKLTEIQALTRTAVNDVSYTALTSDRTISFTAVTAARTVTLPAASAFPTGQLLWIIDESGACSSANVITVAHSGSDTIDGGASAILNAAYDSLAIVSNGVGQWTVVVDALNQEFSLLSVGTPPDPGNPLSVAGASALFNGANFNLTINKSSPANTASIIFEDGFSGRAQIGLNGSDNYSFKVSANGSSWTTAIAIDAATGATIFANTRTAVSDASYSGLVTDRLIAYTSITSPRTVTLPAAGAFSAGQALTIVDESGSVSATNTITVFRGGSDTINGGSSTVIALARGFVSLESNGSNAWTVVAQNSALLSGATFTGSVVTAAGTASLAPLKLTSGTNLATPVSGAFEYDGVVAYFTVAASERGVLPAEQFQVLTSAYTLSSQTAAQKLLNATTNGAITLAVGAYKFECIFSLSSLSGTSGSFGFALGGSATFTQSWEAIATQSATLAAPTSPTATFNIAANTTLTAPTTNTYGHAIIKGIVRVTVAGTIVPQVSLTVAAAAVVGANSYFKASPLGASVVIDVGAWS